MKKLLIVCIVAVLPSMFVNAQLLNLPESVEYDPYNNRYLVSNWGTGNLVQIDSLGSQSVWLSNVQCFAGLHRIDSILYVACREYGVKGFNLFTGENVLNVNIPGATNINDIISDNSGNLYGSSPNGNLIYKINIASEQAWIFADDNLNVPNGMYFDGENNRIILVSFRMNTSIQQISLADSTVSLVSNTGLHNFDGISRDAAGNYYVSSWYTNSVYKYDAAFTNPPEEFSVHSGDPADIFFDKINNVLAVPLFYTNQLEFVAGPVTGLFIDEAFDAGGSVIVYNSPNPFTTSTAISIQIPGCNDFRSIELLIYNINGEKIKSIPFQICNSKLMNTIFWKGTDDSGNKVPPGIYCYVLDTGISKITRKMILL